MANFGSQTSRYNRLVIVFVALGSLTYGFCASVISSTIGQPGWYAFFELPAQGEPGYATVTTNAIAAANGLFSAGGAVGSLFMMWSCEAWGRKVNIQLGSFLAILGGALQGGAANLKMFQAGRFVSGASTGVLVTACPMYFAEISSPFVRGWLVGHHAIFLVFGYMLACWIGYACYFATGSNPAFAWRFPLCFQILSPLLLLMGSPWLPRSPRWLISKGKYDEALVILRRLRQSKDDPQDLVAREEFYRIKKQVMLEAEKLAATGYGVWTAVVKKKSYRRRMIIGFLTQWGTEFGGPLIILVYTPLSISKSLPQTNSSKGLIYNPLGAWLHDKINSRRKMYIIGLIGVIITTSCLAAMTAEYTGTKNRVGSGFGIFFIFLYVAFQGTFCHTTMYLYVSEIFPTEIRPIGMGFSTFGQFASTIILLQTAPIGFAHVGWRYYLVPIIWSVLFIPVIYFFFPETARLSLEEIARKFGEEVAVDVTTQEEKTLAGTPTSKDLIETGGSQATGRGNENA
ncbi:conserved hypothetical protein [Uncinocarpus reesii 1704]|uniref:Major facilitator superfamily (MFS) profile domain-containing protein n=1 Tax=Uncinocarpus reesii (strain UAMH 1704) TaxID=336963 RepID=C4JFQ7_UNCRE|nr:uncharacterized protein UREG_02391 [Uncinocarpus reesii 1704]EEP77542.1 conserved hypothetical protein [Uncinocarpus reesii 1704]